MKILSYVFTVLSLACATWASSCNRDIECLTRNAQITFIGEVVTKDESNTKYFSATVRPLCTMYGNSGSSITADEYTRTITIGGFGSHAGGTCQAEIGNVGEVDIFFVHVNNTVAAGGIRTFGLYDPCYGAFPNNTDNFVALTKFTYGQSGYVPTGTQCPVVTQDTSHIFIDGVSYDKTPDLSLDSNDGSSNTNTNTGSGSFDLDTDNSGASKTMVMTSSAILVLFALFFQFF